MAVVRFPALGFHAFNSILSAYQTPVALITTACSAPAGESGPIETTTGSAGSPVPLPELCEVSVPFVINRGTSTISSVSQAPTSDTLTSLSPSVEPTCYTSSQWLVISGTTLFWPTSTDYLYGPTDSPGVDCAAQWIQYDGRSGGLESLGPTATSTLTELIPTSTGACTTSSHLESYYDTHTGPVTTLCDGHARALGPRETVTDYYPGTGACSTFYIPTTITTTLYNVPSASPTCQLDREGCKGVWETYKSRSRAYKSSISVSIPGDTNSPLIPGRCPMTTSERPEQCGSCHFLPDTATLFYWPVTTAGSDLCAQNGTTIPATPTGNGPNTAMLGDQTLVSPSAYIFFTSIYAWGNSRHAGQCGEYHENKMISVNPTTITSRRGHRNARYPIRGTAYPFNFAEFLPQTVGNYTQPLIPWPQYWGGSQCGVYDSACTLIRDDYLPFIDMPSEVTQIDAKWENCDCSWYIPAVTLVPIVDGTWWCSRLRRPLAPVHRYFSWRKTFLVT
ncbi:unnamed protein product [Aspergillus oryzae RIB40]|uniref:DNA, SC011 n=1 Tax=Aspergillus oryzae (strain ATCC 42149 / RIB 40) TaxID=510516 RepID=Q2U0Y4_ASPOR|nr:unnamed protein product [Aspergillus oryzae RIB40]BAE64781.1 unnamed protein product [Aspergillus oryzae RIB40]